MLSAAAQAAQKSSPFAGRALMEFAATQAAQKEMQRVTGAVEAFAAAQAAQKAATRLLHSVIAEAEMHDVTMDVGVRWQLPCPARSTLTSQRRRNAYSYQAVTRRRAEDQGESGLGSMGTTALSRLTSSLSSVHSGGG